MGSQILLNLKFSNEEFLKAINLGKNVEQAVFAALSVDTTPPKCGPVEQRTYIVGHNSADLFSPAPVSISVPKEFCEAPEQSGEAETFTQDDKVWFRWDVLRQPIDIHDADEGKEVLLAHGGTLPGARANWGWRPNERTRVIGWRYRDTQTKPETSKNPEAPEATVDGDTFAHYDKLWFKWDALAQPEALQDADKSKEVILKNGRTEPGHTVNWGSFPKAPYRVIGWRYRDK